MNHLKSSEWLLIGSLALVMASLVLIAKVNARRAESTLSAQELGQEKVLVSVEGAVKKPGEYWVLEGSLVEEVLRKAKATPYADRGSLPLMVDGSMKIVVKEVSEVVVRVQGAVVEPVELRMPKESRISDLRSKVLLTPDADRAFFNRKKRLKNGEIVEVPKKTVE